MNKDNKDYNALIKVAKEHWCTSKEYNQLPILKSGIYGILGAIQMLGFREWLQCSWVRHCLIDEHEAYNALTGN
jgi:hypothetical protein